MISSSGERSARRMFAVTMPLSCGPGRRRRSRPRAVPGSGTSVGPSRRRRRRLSRKPMKVKWCDSMYCSSARLSAITSAASGGGWRLMSAHSLSTALRMRIQSPHTRRTSASAASRRRRSCSHSAASPMRSMRQYCHDSRAPPLLPSALSISACSDWMAPLASRQTRSTGWMISCAARPSCASVMLSVSTRKGMSSMTSSITE